MNNNINETTVNVMKKSLEIAESMLALVNELPSDTKNIDSYKETIMEQIDSIMGLMEPAK